MIGTLLLPFHVVIIPQYILFNTLGLVDTFIPLILPKFLATEAFFVFLLVQFIRQMPRDMDEAARIDGAGHIRIFWSIILPLIKPALITCAIFAFIWAWNDFLGPLLYLTKREINNCHGGKYFKRPECVTCQITCLVHQFDDSDRGKDRGILEESDPHRRHGRHHPHDSLRQDDPSHRLRAAHPERIRGVTLAAIHGVDPGPVDFRHESSDVQSKRDKAGKERRQGDADHQREDGEDPDHLDQEWRRPEQFGEYGGRNAENPPAAQARQGNQEADYKADGH